jgi:hypothetical protein
MWGTSPHIQYCEHIYFHDFECLTLVARIIEYTIVHAVSVDGYLRKFSSGTCMSVYRPNKSFVKDQLNVSA